jgi:predicted MFS family arabinose efflux permease
LPTIQEEHLSQSGAPHQPSHRPRRKIPDFVIFSSGQGISSIGGWMQKTAVGWLAWDLTHSPAWVGAIALSDLIAALWVAPLAGAVTDRSNPFRLILLTQSLMIGLALLLWFLTSSGLLTIWLLLGWAIFEASIQGFNQPVRMVAIGSLATPDRMSQAIATNSIAVNTARSIGPAIAGLVMVSGEVENVFLINSVSYIAMILAIFWLRQRLDRPGLSSRAEPILRDITLGFAYIRHTPSIATLFFLAVGFAVLARPFVELFPAIAGDILQGGPQTLSLLMSAQGIGALVGAVWMLKAKPVSHIVKTTFGAALGIALTLVLFSLTTHLYLVVIIVTIAGVFHVVCNIGMQTMAQTMSEPLMKGRVMALYGLIFRAGPAIGAFTMGACASWIGLQWLLGIAAAMFGALVIYKIPQIRRVYFSPPSA